MHDRRRHRAEIHIVQIKRRRVTAGGELKRDAVEVRDAIHSERAERDIELPPRVGWEGWQFVRWPARSQIIVIHGNLDNLPANGTAIRPEIQIGVRARIKIAVMKRNRLPRLAG